MPHAPGSGPALPDGVAGAPGRRPGDGTLSCMPSRPALEAPRMTVHRPTRLLLAAALLGACSLAAIPGSAGAASPTACRVRNVDTGITKRSLSAAVSAASEGHRLQVKGTCHGITEIDRDLTIIGVKTPASGVPRLDGDDLGSVVEILSGTSVTIRGLSIVDGTAEAGGGIYNGGTLTLRKVRIADNRTITDGDGAGIYNAATLQLFDSVVTGNRSPGASSTGGGIYNAGAATLWGTTVVRQNRAGFGGGLYNAGAASLHDSSALAENTAGQKGGGAFNSSAMTLFETTAVTDNHSGGDGGGIYTTSAFTLQDASTVRRNTSGIAITGIGGIYSTSSLGATCTPPRVQKNTPVNCSDN